MKILIVEDEPSLQEMMTRTLRAEKHVVETASTYAEVEDRLAVYAYDCVLLDIMLPDGDGLGLLSMLKSGGRREAVIIISARDSLDDKIRGLEDGADDYLPKPFHLAELSARIRSVARRTMGGGRNGITFGNVTVEPESFRATVGGRELPLLKKEFDILSYFMQRPGHVIDKAVLAEAVWGDHVDQADNFNFVYSQVKNLRRKLEEAGATIELKAVYGFGYKLVFEDGE